MDKDRSALVWKFACEFASLTSSGRLAVGLPATRLGRARTLKTVSLAALALAMPAAAAFAPSAAQAATVTWNGSVSNAWETAGNWTGGLPITTSAVTIANLTNNPVQLNSNVSLSGTGGALTVGAGVAPGQANSLNINSGDTLTMGARPVTLDGGSITGLGTLSATGTISGYGTISSQVTGTNFSATATNGANFGGFSPFVNGTPGTPITLIGQNNLTNDSFAVSNHGNFNFQGVTLTTPTLTGVSTNLNAGSLGGNNYYGLSTFSGAASTVVGNVNNTNYEQFDINGTTVHLNNFSLTNSWATNVPPFFVINSGGTLDNTVGNSNLTGHMAVVLNGGSLTNSGGGTFTAPGLITGYGLVSGPITVNGGLTAGPGTTSASSGTLTVDGTSAPITIGATGWGSSAGFVLDMKGTFNYPSTGGFLNPGGGTVQFDGATLNNTSGSGGHTIYTGAGSMVFASGTTTLNTAVIPNGSTGAVADYTVDTGATLNVNNPNTGVYVQPEIFAHNFTMQSGSAFSSTGASAAIADTSIELTGNFSEQQTDPNAWTYGATAGLGPDLIMTGGTSLSQTTLEVGGVNEGNVPAGFVQNFALDSLTVGQTGTGKSGYVELVDQYANATPSGWTSGVEALYLDHLYGFSTTAYGVLNLDGLDAYLQGYGMLQNGIFTDPNGDLVDVIGAPSVPESSTWVMMLLGFAGLGFAGYRRSAARTTV